MWIQTKSGEYIEWYIQKFNGLGHPISPKKLIAYNSDIFI
jgi:hypothetical protein